MNSVHEEFTRELENYMKHHNLGTKDEVMLFKRKMIEHNVFDNHFNLGTPETLYQINKFANKKTNAEAVICRKDKILLNDILSYC